ncbi:MAG: twin-arginine translocation signal domain-containing protein, partial [Haliea sp.]|nr:twin-arginine translocation signal domain-containing protein [Haliea sp.]
MTKKKKGASTSPEITRRDFVGGTLIGSGAALLLARAPALLAQTSPAEAYKLQLGQSMPLPLTGLDESWTGPGGVGDYAVANGDT